MKLANVLRRAHSLALRERTPPPVVRPIVSDSWRRAVNRGVNPSGWPPLFLDTREAQRQLAHHPASKLLPTVEKMLIGATGGAGCFAALSDAEGVLLWVDGNPKALDTAAELGFQPGHLCSESAVGTNAVGTSLELGHAVQIFSAEHFSRRLHALTCAAAPIRDPESRRIIGVLDLSGDFRTGHPHSLALVSAVAKAIEGMLVQELAKRENVLRARYIDLIADRDANRSALVSASGRVLAASPRGWLGRRVRIEDNGKPLLPDGLQIDSEPIDPRTGAYIVRAARAEAARKAPKIALEPIAQRRLRISTEGWSFELAGRRGEIVALLALHPEGLTAEELRSMLAGSPGIKPVTVRAEISRLRRTLGPIIASKPYRLKADLHLDRRKLDQMLRPGVRSAADDL